MAWTYTDDPENNNTDAVRLLIGDTDSSDQQLTDAEVDFFISQEANNYAAACSAATALAGKYARLVDKEVGDLKIEYSQRQRSYENLCNHLSARAGFGLGTVFAGGVSIADKDSENEDTDRVQPYFKRNQFDSIKTVDNANELRSDI